MAQALCCKTSMTSFYTPTSYIVPGTHSSCSQPLCLLAGCCCFFFWCAAQEHVERRRGRVEKGRCSPSCAGGKHHERSRGLITRLRAGARLDRRVRVAAEISPGLVIVVVFGRTAIFYGSVPWKVPPLFDARRRPSGAVSRAWPMGEHSLARVARTEPFLRPA